MSDERIMGDENLELVDLSEITEAAELSDAELDEVNGGKVVNLQKGAFTTKTEAELYAETKFRPGAWYNYRGMKVQCISTGAKMSGKYWFSTCFFRTSDNRTGYATIGYFATK